MSGFLKRAVWEVVRTALVFTVVCLFALAIWAVVVRACLLSEIATIAVGWAVKSVAIFVSSVFLIGRERALFKGIAAGLFGTLLCMLLFAAVGGGFHLSAFFLLELLVVGLLGGAGALVGTKLRKET